MGKLSRQGVAAHDPLSAMKGADGEARAPSEGAVSGLTSTYLAFISYSHHDGRFAEWLQRRLENYRLPRATLREAPGLSKRVRPVFLDKTDETSGILTDTLNEALAQSGKLIVVCSPAAARSEWVNKEVAAFIESGRYSEIIPVIVGGIPFSDDECFPPVLRQADADRQLLGIDVPSFGKRLALIRVVAALLGIRYDSLLRRHAQASRRRLAGTVAGALSLALVVLGVVWQVQQQARIPGFASSLAARAISLSNRDPEQAAYLALAADALHSSDETRAAEFTVAQNNRYVVGSASVSSDPIRHMATDGQTILAAGVGAGVTVLSEPNLSRIGTIATERPEAQVAYRGTNEEFVVLDAGKLSFYAASAGQLPMLVQSIDLGFVESESTFGPFVDSLGGVLVLSESMKGLYWSPVTHKSFSFDLSTLTSSLTGSRIVAASGFAPDLDYNADDETTNGATSQAFVFATGRHRVATLHLSEDADTGGGFWLGPSFEVTRGNGVTALGWQGKSLLVGTAAGLSQWDEVDSYVASETAFPLGGVADSVASLSPCWQPFTDDRETVAVVTASGVRLVRGDQATTLSGVTAAVTAHSPVTSITAAPNGTWIAGRSNGSVTRIDPQAKPLSSGETVTNASAKAVATDGTVLLSSGSQQFATGLKRYRLAVSEEGHDLQEISSYTIPEGIFRNGVFFNDVVGDEKIVVAAGKRQPLNGSGVVLVWKQPGSEPTVLDFPAESLGAASSAGYDMISAVTYAPKSRVIAAYNALQGSVAIWSLDTGERMHTVQLRGSPNGHFPSGRNGMASSADGELVAVAVEGRISIVETARGRVLDTFDKPDAFPSLSPDGTRLALIAPDRISITDLRGKEAGSISASGDMVTVAWSNDGSVLAVTSVEARELDFFDTLTFHQIGLPWVNPSGYLPVGAFWVGDSHLLVSNASLSPSGSAFESKEVDVIEPLANTYQRQLCGLAWQPVSDELWNEIGGAGIPKPKVCPAATSSSMTTPAEESPQETPIDTRTVVGDIAFAPVPGDGLHPAGRLFFGRLPLVSTADGEVSLNRDRLAQVSLIGGEPQVLAVLDSNGGGIGWPQQLVLYGRGADGPVLISSLALGDVAAISADHVVVGTLSTTADGVAVTGSSYYGAGFDIREWSGIVQVVGTRLVLTDLQITKKLNRRTPRSACCGVAAR